MSLRTEERQNRYVVRALRLSIVAAALFLCVVAGYWHTQVLNGTRYRQLAENNRLRDLVIPAPRGLILDRDGRPLVENNPSYLLQFDRGSSNDIEASLAFASRVLSEPLETLERQLDLQRRRSRSGPIRLAEELSLAEVAHFEATGLEHPEFEIEVELRRFYRHGAQTAHVLGYIGEVSESQLESNEDLRAGDLVGVKGTERSYDQLLRGTKGRRVVVVDSHHRLVEEHLRIPSERGTDLESTLDLELQQEAERYLADRVGSIVAMDPDTGEIVAMISAPSYNPNVFAGRLDSEEWQKLLAQPHDPLQNRAVQNTYPPGSVFKMITAIGALEEKAIDEDFSVYCNGRAVIYNHAYRCWQRGGHGRVDMHDAIRHSCDVFFYYAGQKLGIDRLADHAREWGLGRPTGIDIAGEKGGLVPDREWKVRTHGTAWYPGETISVAIGQGPLLVTPLQIAVMTAAIANGGKIVQPHLVRREGPNVVRSIDVDRDILSRIHGAMWSVVNDGGTAAASRSLDLDIVGKTGTAQVISQKGHIDSSELAYRYRDHAWFTSFAPVDDPKLVIVVFVEHGGHGSLEAAPLAKRLYEKYFGTPTVDRST